MICKTCDVVVAIVPYSDKPNAKRRPAVVLSNEQFNSATGHTLIAMVTTAKKTKWPGDIPLKDYADFKLRQPSVIRLKFFTIDNRFITHNLGALDDVTARSLSQALAALVPISLA